MEQHSRNWLDESLELEILKGTSELKKQTAYFNLVELDYNSRTNKMTIVIKMKKKIDYKNMIKTDRLGAISRWYVTKMVLDVLSPRIMTKVLYCEIYFMSHRILAFKKNSMYEGPLHHTDLSYSNLK